MTLCVISFLVTDVKLNNFLMKTSLGGDVGSVYSYHRLSLHLYLKSKNPPYHASAFVAQLMCDELWK